MSAVVRTEGLTKVFISDWRRARTTAVDALDLEVGEGEIYGFRVMFMPLGERLAMIQDGAISELERCN